MQNEIGPAVTTILRTEAQPLAEEWIRQQQAALSFRKELVPESELRQQAMEFIRLLGNAVHAAAGDDSRAPWTEVQEFLAALSRSRSQLGFSPSDTATFVFSLKRPLFVRLQQGLNNNGAALAREYWAVTELLDKLGLYTIEMFQKGREEIIRRQTEEMLELSTPVMKLWDGILALPMIGTLDSARTQVVMETLLERIVETGCEIAIIDITGVPTVDTLVAQHLLKTVSAARLMGAECIISGIRPNIAQTIVHLAIDLSNVITKATLADAFSTALQRLRSVSPNGPGKSAVPARGNGSAATAN